MLIDDYFVHQLNFEKKYGNKTIVLMQVGTFFELYGVNNEIEKIGDVQTITELLNIQLTRRNKAILENSRNNCLMAGFPLNSLKRFINILLTNNYTVILIEQTSEPPNPKREITQIYSPGTYIEEINQSDQNNIVSLFITEDSCYKNGQTLFVFGISSIDLSTGINTIYEGKELYYEKNAFFEEIYRFIESFNPKEIIVNFKNLHKIKLDELRMKINNIQRVVHYQTDIESKFFNLHYQNQFLKKIFMNSGILTPIEYIDMEKKNSALISYLILLQFSYEHNERIIDKIQKPIHWEYDDHLILYNNAIYQLNIISLSGHQIGSKYKSLFDIIQKTSTNMGKRLLKHRIMNPITNINILNKRYELIDLLMNSDKLLYIEKILNEIIDLERLHRKISLQMLHPYEFLNLSYSYENIKKLFIIFKESYDLSLFNISINTINEFNTFITYFENLFIINEMGKYGLLNIGNSFFKKGNYLNIDEIQNNIDEINKFFNNECKFLSNIIEENSDFVKLENNDRDGYFYYTTKKRSEILLNKFNKTQKEKYEIKKYNGANIKITSEEIIKNSNKLIELKEEIKKLTKEVYLKTLNNIDEKYMETLNEITKFIALIDVIKCSVLCAKIYKYNKPQISDINNGMSFFNAKEIRHPIIEIINEEVDYVKNDIYLKHDENNGILLYGVNGAGKSSLSKAVGCNILLAQIGFYVPSKEFIYYPYKKIFTRINGDDNIFKGMSSFAVEMDELRSILKYSDNRSIVLGDEICKGTEETSALSIVSASIMRFCKNNVNFILATHFHKLCEIEEINNLKNIKFMHLTVDFNNDNDNKGIIYGRKLKDGTGSNLYGIEIANYIIEDDLFIENAKSIRNILLNKNNEILSNKTSNYNSHLYMDKCIICEDNGMSYPLDTHHIKEQNTFDDYDINKDKLSNIVVLCKKHHDSVHNGNLEINGYIYTTIGKKLEYNFKENNEKKVSKKKFNEEQIKVIKDLALELKDQQQFCKIMIKELKKKDINISQSILNKICNNNY